MHLLTANSFNKELFNNMTINQINIQYIWFYLKVTLSSFRGDYLNEAVSETATSATATARSRASAILQHW